MTINKVYVITHPFYTQESRLPKNKREEWSEQRLRDVLDVIEKAESDPNAYLVFYCSGLEPKKLTDKLNNLDKNKAHVFRGPNDYSLNNEKDKKLGSQSFEKEIELYTFGAYKEACINETTGTITDYLKNKTKVVEVIDLGSDSLHKLCMGKTKTNF